MKRIKINNKYIGENEPLYFIADIGANHDGSLDRAYKLIELAKEAGADAAKFQNFIADKIVSNVGFQNLGGQLSHQAKWKKSVYEVYKDASVSFSWTEKLKQKCDEVGIEYFTSPYDFESVDLVDPYVNVYKIGSGDITWVEIIEYIAKKGKPVMLATGASSMQDVIRAMNILEALTDNIVLMQCNTNYTGDINNFNYINLNVLLSFKNRFPGTLLGLSDHTPGHVTVLGALALGARVFEKHFTDDNNREGPDHKFAMNPQTWREMVERSNELYVAMGDGKKVIEENEKQSSIVQRRSIRVTRNISAGEIISNTDIEVLRPCPEGGLPPYMTKSVIGKALKSSILAGEHLTQENSITND
jgi:N-acetylneuraminate synthase